MQKNSVEDFSLTTRLIIKEAWRRGWRVHTPELGSSHLYIDRSGKNILHLQGSILPTLKYVNGTLVNDKYLTYKLLEEAGLEQLPTMHHRSGSNISAVEEFLKRHKTVVVKPVDGAHGRGISINVETPARLETAINDSSDASSRHEVIIQKQFPGDKTFDLRLLCMDGEFVAAIYRVPAGVYGDGAHSLKELIDIENSSPDRGDPYKNKYARIDVERVHHYLGSSIDAIPVKGQRIQVVATANYGTGGELIDITDNIPLWMRKEAEHASSVLKLPVSGVDYLVDCLPNMQTQRKDCLAFIIEVNKGPSLCIHDQPHEGENRQTVKRFMDMVAQC